MRTPASPTPRAEPAKPASITDLAQQLTAIQAQLSGLIDAPTTPASSRSADIERRAAQRADATVSHLAQQFASLQAQLGAVGDRLESVAAPVASSDTRALERTAGAITELSQQLAATQAQVASLAAQLTTLAHRVTYDLERAGQTTVERVLRDLPTAVGAVLGPAIDDLTDQVEADAARVTEVVEGTISTRLASVGEIVDELPQASSELLSAVQRLETDLEGRFDRLANRLGDQITAFEEANAAELARLRDHVFDLADAQGGAAPDREITDRMAAQVDLLAQSTVASDTAEAVEGLVAEHLEVLRDELETRLGTLAPALQEELEAVRAETASGIDTATEALVERLDALEAALTSSVDAALAEQLEGLDALVTERINTAAAASAAAAATVADTEGTTEGETADALAAITDELKALRRRITLRLEGDAPTGLTPEQVEDLAAQVARRLGTDRPARRSGPRLSPDPVDAAGTTRATRKTDPADPADPIQSADATDPKGSRGSRGSAVPVVRTPRSAKRLRG